MIPRGTFRSNPATQRNSRHMMTMTMTILPPGAITMQWEETETRSRGPGLDTEQVISPSSVPPVN